MWILLSISWLNPVWYAPGSINFIWILLFSKSNSFFKLVVSAIKKAEDKDGYIIRLYNGQFHEEESDTLVFTQNIKKAYYVDLKEEYADSIEVVDNTIHVKPLTHCKFTTIYVETE